MESIKDMPIEKLQISVRTYNCLKRYGVSTVGELSLMTARELSKVRNLGLRNIEEIVDRLGDVGLSLKKEEEEEFC